ncbi:MAG TPA: hypothetical protein VFN15_02645 [Solirubrobacterales bacterium]|nr:hypothetical protein [Solirubrobacterales bacterium]
MAGDPANPPEGVPADALDGLYHGPLEEFTPGRNELAKSLRADGDKGAADWVKGLRKPTRAAWIANQLAARRRGEVEELLKVGEELRALQEKLLVGSGDRDRLRDAARAEREAIDRLLKGATEIAEGHNAGTAAVDRVGETLQAATVDADLAEALRLGRIRREQRATSLGLAGGAAAPPRGGDSGSGARGKAKGGKRGGPEVRAAEERARRELARRREATQRKLTSAERKLERERAAAERAREALTERERRVADAERSLAAARRELKQAR